MVAATTSLKITLPLEMAELVRAKVESGRYASESDVIADSLRALAEDDAAFDRWLVEDVGPTVDAIDAGREKTYSLEETRERLQSRISGMVAGKG